MSRESARHWSVLLAVGFIVLSVLAAYHNSFSVPLLFDDVTSIQTNASIRHLWPLGSVLSPPDYAGSAGRPFLNLTFALNYALGGFSVESYHAFNLLIHIVAGITLFGIVRLTLSQPKLKDRYGSAALLLASAVAILWALHPIQTESVTYISQRAESLMGLFYLLTLYFFIRAAVSPAPGLWASLAVAACALGMATKEVMVSAPLIVILYDRAFLAGTFREAWRRRWRIYLGLAATWLVLGGLMLNSKLQNRAVGYGNGFTSWTYALTESKVVVDYLKLALFPHPLIFDHGPFIIKHAVQAAPYLLLLALLLSLTLVALCRWPSLGFLGAWFFLILAPTSSLIPLAGEPMGENRMYLPLAAIVAGAIFALYARVGRKGLLVAVPAFALALAILTVRRNSDYRDDLTLWNDTVSKCPGNSRAYYNLGNVFLKAKDRLPDAIAAYETALKLDPYYIKAHDNLGKILARTPGRLPDAIAHYEIVLKLDPEDLIAHYNLGNALAKTRSRLPDAVAQYEAVLKIDPDYAKAHFNLGYALLAEGRNPEAWAQFEAAVRLRPDWGSQVARLRAEQASVGR